MRHGKNDENVFFSYLLGMMKIFFLLQCCSIETQQSHIYVVHFHFSRRSDKG